MPAFVPPPPPQTHKPPRQKPAQIVTPAGEAEHSRTGCFVLGFVALTFAGILVALLALPPDAVNVHRIAEDAGLPYEVIGLLGVFIAGGVLIGVIELYSAVGRSSMSDAGRAVYDERRRAGNRKIRDILFVAGLTLLVLLGPKLLGW